MIVLSLKGFYKSKPLYRNFDESLELEMKGVSTMELYCFYLKHTIETSTNIL